MRCAVNRQEVATMLTMIAAVDDRFDPDQPRIAMWTECLDADMDAKFAKEFVVKHYAEQKTVVMPSDVNASWRTFKQRERSRRLFDELEALDAVAAPPPPALAAGWQGQDGPRAGQAGTGAA